MFLIGFLLKIVFFPIWLPLAILRFILGLLPSWVLLIFLVALGSWIVRQIPAAIDAYERFDQAVTTPTAPTLPVRDAVAQARMGQAITFIGNYHILGADSEISTPFGDRKLYLLSDPRSPEIVAAVLATTFEDIRLNLSSDQMRTVDNTRSFPVRLQAEPLFHSRIPFILQNRIQGFGFSVSDDFQVFHRPTDPSENPHAFDFFAKALLIAINAIVFLVLLAVIMRNFRTGRRTDHRRADEQVRQVHQVDEHPYSGAQESNVNLDRDVQPAQPAQSERDWAPKLEELGWHKSTTPKPGSAVEKTSKKAARRIEKLHVPPTPEQEVDRIIRKAFGRRAADRKSKLKTTD